MNYENAVPDEARGSTLWCAAKSSGLFALLVLAIAVAKLLGLWFQESIFFCGLLPRPDWSLVTQ